MYAVEFQAKIKDGLIQVPKEYQMQLSDQVRVILLTKSQPAGESADMINFLLHNPIQLPEFTPLSRDEAHDRA